MSGFKEGVLECNGLPIRYAESGEGRPVVVFSAGESVLGDDIAADLATHHRVIVLDVPASDTAKIQDCAQHLAQSLVGLGVASFSVIGVSQGSTAALAQAIYTSEQVQRLVLLSPPLASMQHPELRVRLREVKAPTLILVGTRDRSGSREAGHMCRAQIPACHLLLVYDAGHAIAADRREACLSPIGEFLEQGEGFIVFHDSQMIRP
ncbi:MAG TPA: alpha/beta hydrolase [Candidatus Binatia bacterium]|nr:alpha/beta hydrolase [Candidatus Binatia bacterium]